MKDKVYDFLKTIPKGKVVTYGQIAANLAFGKQTLLLFYMNELKKEKSVIK